jgi:curli biogenesis system outer membrane secretion channel CsgG
MINRRNAFLLAASGAAIAAVPALAAAPTVAVLNVRVPVIPGPRRTIAVGNIDLQGPAANASATNVGGPVAALLATALGESDEFILVERDAAAQMITEMDMAKSGVTTGTSAPRPGNMLPAQYLVVGSITDYTAPGAGSGLGLSIGGSTAFNFGGSKGDVRIDLRVVDTRTGVVVKAFTVQHKLVALTAGLSSSYAGVPIATNSFFNSPLGDATRKCLNDAVVQIATALAAIPWRGQVVKADSGVIYINAGAQAGVKVGDQLSLQRIGETLTDPATGAVLKQEMVTLGVVTVTEVEPAIAEGSYRRIVDSDPIRGDYVVATQ